MRIMLIELGEFYPRELAIKEDYARSVLSRETTLIQKVIEVPSSLPDDFSRFGLYTMAILKRVKEAEMDGYDAVVIDCFTDSGAESAKFAANIPIVVPAESSLHASCLLADRIGWISPMDEGIPFHWRQAHNYRLANRVTSIRGLNLGLQEIHEKPEAAEEKIIKISIGLLEEGAQLILIGCTGILPALGVGSIKKLSCKLGVTVVDPLGIALKTAEMMVSLGLSQSKLAYPKIGQF